MFLFFLIGFVALVTSLVICLVVKSSYESSTYYKETKKSYWEIAFDKGAKGEYRTLSQLEGFAREGARFLFNLYVPTRDGKTTEIDAVIITPNGVIVVENKNYSGWVFGNANQRYWCQTFPSSRGCEKHRFYNPIWQNGTHIRALREILDKNLPFYSVVVFSNRCTLKKVTTEGTNAHVIYAKDLPWLVSRIREVKSACLTNEEIFRIYQRLYPYAHVNEQVKLQHDQQIKQKHH